MRQSNLFGKTQREIPAEADTISHRLLLRSGMIRQVAAGVYSYLPLAWRVLKKIENIIREEMDTAGGQEILMPTLQPVEIWDQSGRGPALGKILFILNDRRQRKLVLGPTHEEVVTEMAGANVHSYRDLPLMLYQIQNKFRDEPRPRGGLLRVREFIMKDLYSFDVDEAGLDKSYQRMLEAYRNIFNHCGLPTLMVEADSGAIGGKDSHEFIVTAENGEDEVIYCDGCQYSANVEKATCIRVKVDGGQPLVMEEVSTPGKTTIKELSDFFKITSNRTLKAVFYIADEELVFVVIRGDLEVNETKLQNALQCSELRMASETEVGETGLVPGFASPVGNNDIKVVADDSVESASNLVAGANKPETHLKNVNYPRDFKADIITDIARTRSGDTCPKCQDKLLSTRGIEVGHAFKLVTSISDKLDARFIDQDGNSQPIIMGCYGMGLGRLLAAAIEQSHDDKGIIWPAPLAPYQIHICALYREGSPVSEVAENLYTALTAEGLEVLLDDRDESPGVKFNDADLLGIPLRVTVSPRSLEKDSVEVKWRAEKDSRFITLDEALKKLSELLRQRAHSKNLNNPV